MPDSVEANCGCLPFVVFNLIFFAAGCTYGINRGRDAARVEFQESAVAAGHARWVMSGDGTKTLSWAEVRR